MKTSLTIIYSLLIPIIYITYLYGLKKKDTTPNAITWFIWMIAGVINAITYYHLVDGNIFKYMVTILAVICASFVFFYAFFKGSFKKLNEMDFIIIALLICVGVFWITSKNQRDTNLLLQLVYIISFVPIAYNLLFKNGKEYIVPFVIALFAYSISIIVILLEWNGDWAEIAYPVANGIIGNGAILLIIIYKNTKKTKCYENTINCNALINQSICKSTRNAL